MRVRVVLVLPRRYLFTCVGREAVHEYCGVALLQVMVLSGRRQEDGRNSFFLVSYFTKRKSSQRGDTIERYAGLVLRGGPFAIQSVVRL